MIELLQIKKEKKGPNHTEQKQYNTLHVKMCYTVKLNSTKLLVNQSINQSNKANKLF